jgi:hypothetical protein
MVSSRASLPVPLTVALVGAVALGGCGSSKTTTVSVSGAATSSSSAQRTTPTERTKTSPSVAAPKSRLPGAQRTTSSGRTASAPAFTQQGGESEGLSTALQVVKMHGFTPGETATYHPSQTLRVLIGTRPGSGYGYNQQAFFFEDGRYLGTDASQPSAIVKVVSQGDTEVTLAYTLYRPHDALCCPKGGEATVRFQLNNGRLQALDPIPPVSSTSGASRR